MTKIETIKLVKAFFNSGDKVVPLNRSFAGELIKEFDELKGRLKEYVQSNYALRSANECLLLENKRLKRQLADRNNQLDIEKIQRAIEQIDERELEKKRDEENLSFLQYM